CILVLIKIIFYRILEQFCSRISQLSTNGPETDEAQDGNQTRAPGNMELHENRNPTNILNENRNAAHFIPNENRSPPNYRTDVNRSPPNYGTGENRSPPRYEGLPPNYAVSISSFGLSDNRNLGIHGQETRNPQNVSLNENRSQSVFTLGEDLSEGGAFALLTRDIPNPLPLTLHGDQSLSNYNRPPNPYGLNQDRNPHNYRSNHDLNQSYVMNQDFNPRNFGISQSAVSPNFVLNDDRNPTNLGLRHQLGYGLNDNRNLSNPPINGGRNPQNYGLNIRSQTNYGLNGPRSVQGLGLNDPRSAQALGLNDPRSGQGLGLNDPRSGQGLGLNDPRSGQGLGLNDPRSGQGLGLNDPRSGQGLGLNDPRSGQGLGLNDPRSGQGLGLNDPRSGQGLGLNDPRSGQGLGLNDPRSGQGLGLNDPRSGQGLGLNDPRSGQGLGLNDPRSGQGLGLNDPRSGQGLGLNDPRSGQGLGLNDPRSGQGLGLNDPRSGQGLGLNDPRSGQGLGLNDPRSGQGLGLNDQPNVPLNEGLNQDNPPDLGLNANVAVGSPPASFALSEGRSSIDDINTLECGYCEKRAVVLYRCCTCEQNLCVGCAHEHTTQNHTMYKFLAAPTPIHCINHADAEANIYCKVCDVPLCNQCSICEHNMHDVSLFKDHMQTLKSMMSNLQVDAKTGKEFMTNHKIQLEKCTEAIKQSYENEQALLAAETEKYVQLLIKRQEELMQLLKNVYDAKMDNMNGQIATISTAINTLGGTDLILQTTNMDDDADIFHTVRQSRAEINRIKSKFRHIEPCEDDKIYFNSEANDLHEAIENFGSIHSSGSAKHSVLAGPDLHYAHVGLRNLIIVHVKDHLGASVLPKFEINRLSLTSYFNGEGYKMHYSIDREPNKSSFRVTYIPKNAGYLTLSLKLRNVNICAPFNVNVIYFRNYSNEVAPITFGDEGTRTGQFCRPWGVCSDGAGNIIVADRSNNRVQVFDPLCTLKFTFGSQGDEPGKFNRPAGIAWDSYLNRIVVVDKDNHRVQIFEMDGKFVKLFGDRGPKNGQFNYPWDVEVNTYGHIIVSDTRNHRLQMFNEEGEFLRKFGPEANTAMWRQFDSPRGISFFREGNVVVTDFNHHRIGIFSSQLQDEKWMGAEGNINHGYGSNELRFLRPQGCATDQEGNIVIADSKNHRIVVCSSTGIVIKTFGSFGNVCGCLDRPSGVAVTPDGRIVIVDFGNNRVQIF
ncbi:hypothetical protein L9F63_007101, partial [Diploptera punctata]